MAREKNSFVMSRVKEHTYSHKYNTKVLSECLELQPDIQLNWVYHQFPRGLTTESISQSLFKRYPSILIFNITW